MKLVFLETPLFTRLLSDHMDDDNYRRLQRKLLKSPDAGNLIPGTGGFRKIRWRDTFRNKGKRGGLRIIYYHLPLEHQIWFFTLYNKDEVIDLSAREKEMLKRVIEAELKSRSTQS